MHGPFPAIFALLAMAALFLVIASVVTNDPASLIAGFSALSVIAMLRYIQRYFTRLSASLACPDPLSAVLSAMKTLTSTITFPDRLIAPYRIISPRQLPKPLYLRYYRISR